MVRESQLTIEKLRVGMVQVTDLSPDRIRAIKLDKVLWELMTFEENNQILKGES